MPDDGGVIKLIVEEESTRGDGENTSKDDDTTNYACMY